MWSGTENLDGFSMFDDFDTTITCEEFYGEEPEQDVESCSPCCGAYCTYDEEGTLYCKSCFEEV